MTGQVRQALNRARNINERLAQVRSRVLGKQESKQADHPNNPSVPTLVRSSLEELEEALSSLATQMQGIEDQLCSIERL